MSLKRIILAAGMALATVAVMAPAAQAEITHNGQPITGHEEIHFEGVTAFNAGAAGSFSCPITLVFTVNAGVPSLISYEPATHECTGTGAFTGCTIETDEFASGPVDVNTATPDITVTDFTFTYHYEPGSCLAPINSTHMIFPESTIRPVSGDSLNTLTISSVSGGAGTPAGHIYSGHLSITPSDEGTYSLRT